MFQLLTVLPMAFVMIAGPQIVTAIVLATGVNARRDSVFFLAGAGAATTLGFTVAYWLTASLKADATSSKPAGGIEHGIDLAIIGLLLFLAWRVFRERSRSKPPAWMARLETASPLFAFRIGFLLFLLLPGDVVTMFTVGAHLARHEAAWWHGLIFVALTVFLVGTPLLLLLLFGKRTSELLPEARDWMAKNSWIVSEVVIGFFLLMTVKSLLGA